MSIRCEPSTCGVNSAIYKPSPLGRILAGLRRPMKEKNPLDLVYAYLFRVITQKKATAGGKGKERRKRCYVCGRDRKSNSYVKMKKKLERERERIKKKEFHAIVFILIEREEEKTEEFKLLKLLFAVELPYQRERGEREQERFINGSIEENRGRWKISSARVHVRTSI